MRKIQYWHLKNFKVQKLQKNIMTVDLEDYFCDLDFLEWNNYESKIEKTTHVLLDLFKNHNVTATFFTLGYIAEKFPHLIKKIVNDGHEIASHSYSHLDIRQSTKEEFESDLLKSLKILEEISGQKILGFRAPYFSINQKTFWALDVIRKYMKYDSSIFPIKTPLYGISKAPKIIYKPSKKNPLKNDESSNFFELPLATFRFLNIVNIPVAGGFHLRFLPYSLIKYGIKKINNEGNSAICYIHPRDLDPEMLKIPQYSWHYYYGLKHSKKKYKKLLQDFKFDSIQNVIKL